MEKITRDEFINHCKTRRTDFSFKEVDGKFLVVFNVPPCQGLPLPYYRDDVDIISCIIEFDGRRHGFQEHKTYFLGVDTYFDRDGVNYRLGDFTYTSGTGEDEEMEASEKMTMEDFTMENLGDWMYRKNFRATEYIWEVLNKSKYNDICEYYVGKINNPPEDELGLQENSLDELCEACFTELANIAESYMWKNTCRDYVMALLKSMEQYHLPEVTLINGKSYSDLDLVFYWNISHAENRIENGEWDTLVY